MAHFTVKKANHAALKITSDIDIAMELSEHFKFMVEGYKFSPEYKKGRWDGSIKLFNLGTRTLPTGLYSKLVEFSKERGYEFDTLESEYGVPGDTLLITYQNTLSYMQSLNLYARGEPLQIRDYQVNGVFQALYNKTAIIEAVTGAGKSALVYSIFRYVTEVLEMRALLIVPTVALTTQMKADFKDYSSHNGYDVEEAVHLISAGCTKQTTKPIVVSTFQSLKDIPADWLNSFGLIMTDEGHKIQSASFKEIYGKATEVPFRLACTGTVHETKCNLLQMIALTGPVHTIAVSKDLIAAGQLVPLSIKAIILNYPKDTCIAFKKTVYEDEIKWLITNPRRNNFIKKLAHNCTGVTLILFRFIEQGEALYKMLKDSTTDRDVYYIDGSVDKDSRETMRLAANTSNAILVASFGCFSTGINLPAIENIIIASPVKSKITFLQSIGRGLRLKEGKTCCNLYDIGDNLSYKSHVNFTFTHFGDRMEILTKEGYKFKVINTNFG